MKSSYFEKLKDPRWQKKRLEIFQRDNFRCQKCMDDASTLNVHHVRYQKGKEPWEYRDYLLVTLCSECHSFTPTATDSLLDSVSRISPAIVFSFSQELGSCEQPPATLRLLTAILQDRSKTEELLEWFNKLPLSKQLGNREGEE